MGPGSWEVNYLGTRREKSGRMPTQVSSLSKPPWAVATWTTTEAVCRENLGKPRAQERSWLEKQMESSA